MSLLNPEAQLLGLPDILAVLTHSMPGTKALFLTDGPTIYGSAVPASLVGATQILGRGDTSASARGAWYAPMVYAIGGNNQSGVYNSAGFNGITGISRPYISGHHSYDAFGACAGSIWTSLLDLPTLSTWNPNGDWLMISSVGDQGAIGAQGGYTLAEWFMGADANTPWIGFGSQNDGGGSGCPTGVFAATSATVNLSGFPANTAYTAAGVSAPAANTIGAMAAHMRDGVLAVYVALPDGIHVVFSGAYTPGASAAPFGARFVSQRHLFGSGDLTTAQRILVQGLIAGTMTADQVALLLYSILRGLPVYSPPCPCLPYQMCVLDSLVYDFNPVQNQNPLVRRITQTETMLGRNLTDWGSDASRRDIVQEWPVLPCCFFEKLVVKVKKGIPLNFTDDDGATYVVLPEALTYERKTPGGQAYMGVKLRLLVLSGPS